MVCRDSGRAVTYASRSDTPRIIAGRRGGAGGRGPSARWSRGALLALLRVRAPRCSPAPLGRPPALGDRIWIVGFPWGRQIRLISGMVSEVNLDDQGHPREGAALMVDASVAYGMSGGGVFDGATGSLVGLIEGYGTARVPFGQKPTLQVHRRAGPRRDLRHVTRHDRRLPPGVRLGPCERHPAMNRAPRVGSILGRRSCSWRSWSAGSTSGAPCPGPTRRASGPGSSRSSRARAGSARRTRASSRSPSSRASLRSSGSSACGTRASRRRSTTRSGKRVVVHYREHRGLPTSCFGETSYFVTGIRTAE